MSREVGYYHLVYNGDEDVGLWDGMVWNIIGCSHNYYDDEFDYIGEKKLELPPLPSLLKEGHYWIKPKQGSDWEIWEGFREPEGKFAFTKRSKFIDIEDIHKVGDFIPTPED